MSVDYNYSENISTLTGPQAALPVLFAKDIPSSLLDVGCGTGTWLKAALDLGIREVCGLDGGEIPRNKLHVSAEKIRYQDLTEPWDLDRQFDLVLCLEVAEHLDSSFAPMLIDALVKHGERIVFSAACPGQGGQHHVNCQWPIYWQELFNERGFACEDSLRWQIWDDQRIEPWYRQNLFIAERAPEMAGHEPRIRSVLHPVMWKLDATALSPHFFKEHLREIEQGKMPVMWNVTLPVHALLAKVKRKLNNYA